METLTKKAQAEQEKQETIKTMKKILKPGKVVYSILRHVSQSGMSRRISFFTIGTDKKPFDLDWYIEKLGDYKRSQHHQGLVVGGCGMDMGFSVVYNVSSILYPKGFKLAKNQHGRNGDTSGYDNNGGYALKQEWF